MRNNPIPQDNKERLEDGSLTQPVQRRPVISRNPYVEHPVLLIIRRRAMIPIHLQKDSKKAKRVLESEVKKSFDEARRNARNHSANQATNYSTKERNCIYPWNERKMDQLAAGGSWTDLEMKAGAAAFRVLVVIESRRYSRSQTFHWQYQSVSRKDSRDLETRPKTSQALSS